MSKDQSHHHHFGEYFMKRILFSVIASLVIISNAYASDCVFPDQVTFCQTVGTSKEFDFDTIFLVKALSDNNHSYQELLSRGRFAGASVEIKPARSTDFSNEVVLTLKSSNGSIFTPPEFTENFQLILSGHYDLRIQDEAPIEWTTSGVQQVRN